jgi:hypothetical protein
MSQLETHRPQKSLKELADLFRDTHTGANETLLRLTQINQLIDQGRFAEARQVAGLPRRP